MNPKDEVSRARARHSEVNMLVEAGAGTGKTTLLVDRVIQALLEREIPLSRMLLITFMDKAQDEMRRRVSARLTELAAQGTLGEREGRLVQAALEALPNAAITTIHGFCQRILGEFGSDYGIPVGFQVLDPVDVERLWQTTFDQWIEEVAGDERGARTMRLLQAGIRWNQLLKWARPISDWPAVPSTAAPWPRIDAFLKEYGVTARQLASRAVGEAAADESGVRQIAEIARRFDLIARMDPAEWPRLLAQWTDGLAPKGAKTRWEHPEALTAQKEWIGLLKDALADLRRQLSDYYLSDWLALIGEDFAPRWRRTRFASLALTFDDLLLEARRIIGQPAVARALSRRYDLVMVDEFQDTDATQSAVIRRLVTINGQEELSAQDQGRLFLVGDPKQSIYRFRGADVETYAEVRDELLRTGGELVHITENFRSLPAILECVNNIFQAIWPAHADAARPFIPPFVPLSTSLMDDHREHVRMVALGAGESVAAKRRAEAQDLASAIQQAMAELWPVRVRNGIVRPIQYGDMAIIMPQRTDWEIYRDALKREGIPVAAQSGRKFFDKDEVRGVRHLFRALWVPEDAVAAVGWLLSPWVGLDYATLVGHRSSGGSWDFRDDSPSGHPEVLRWWRILKEWHQLFWRVDAETVLDWAMERSDLVPVLRERDDAAALANLTKLRRLARDFGDRWGIFEFAHWLDRQVREHVDFEEAKVGPGDSEVTFSTVHQAKGLEWPLVFVANWRPPKTALDTGIQYNPRLNLVALRQPPWQSSHWDRLEADHRLREEAEGDRLLYVALTRARDYLWFYTSFLDRGDQDSWT